MKFSIIVPVYNVQNYLKECVNSLLAQDYSDMEVLLIDDGSTDDSGKICDDFAEAHEIVTVYHKPNGGLSDARNFGIDHASGKYIVFVDSDDWVAEGCIKKFDEVIGDADVDILETTLVEVYGDDQIRRDSDIELFFNHDNSIDKLVDWKLNKSYNTWPSVKMIYSRDFILRHGLRFQTGRLHEDIDWTSNVIYVVERFKVCSYPWYYHRMQRSDSITNTVKAKNITDVVEMAAQHYEKKRSKVRREQVFRRIMISVYVKIKQINDCTEEDKKKAIHCLNSNKVIFQVTPGMKYRAFVTLMKMMGTEKAVNLLSLIS